MENYVVGKRVGRGNYGTVHVAEDKRNSRRYCLKQIQMEAHSDEERQQAMEEVRLLASLDHPGIVKYHEHFMHEDSLCVVMAYCEGGDLSQHIKRRAKAEEYYEEHEVLDFFIQIVMVRVQHRMSQPNMARVPNAPSSRAACCVRRRWTTFTASASCTGT